MERDAFGLVHPHTYFLGKTKLGRANSDSIHSALLEILRTKGIDIMLLRGISTDGAAVMVGIKSGLVQKLTGMVPGILATHCIAHRLALSCCSAADKIPYLVKFQELLNSIYTTQNLLRITFSFNDLMLKTNRLKKDFFYKDRLIFGLDDPVANMSIRHVYYA